MDFKRALLGRVPCYFAITCFALLSTSVSADQVLEWNQILAETLRRDTEYQNPGMASRSTAMMNLAIYDALNLITPEYEPFYSYSHLATPGSSEQAAVVQAGYRVLANIYPGQESFLEVHRSRSLEEIAASGESTASIDAGIAVGNEVGMSVAARRTTDGFMNMVQYEPANEPGRWQPDPLNPDQQAWGPEWGQIEPFALNDASAFLPPPMPSLTDEAYTAAFNEVKALGSKDSLVRTQEQTDIGYFWAYDRLGLGTPLRMYNGVLRSIAADQENSMSENARLFAMASTAMADAGIVAWDSKFQYDFWRPVSGIREADTDGNADTVADPDWEPLGAPGGVLDDGTEIPNFTPPFPTYVSGHASFGGAMFGTLQEFYGTDEIAFSVTSEEMPSMVRSYSRFSDAMAENGRSRVYLGIHWDFDDFLARELGQEVATAISLNHFQPVPEPQFGPILAIMLLALRGQQRRKAA